MYSQQADRCSGSGSFGDVSKRWRDNAKDHYWRACYRAVLAMSAAVIPMAQASDPPVIGGEPMRMAPSGAMPCNPAGAPVEVARTGTISTQGQVFPACAGGGSVVLPMRLVVPGKVNRVDVGKFSVKVKGRTAYQEPKKQYWIDKDTAGHGGSAWNVKEGDPRGKSDLVVSVTASGVPLRGKMIAIAG